MPAKVTRAVIAFLTAALVLCLVAFAFRLVGPWHDELWNLYSSPGVNLGGASWTSVRLGLPGMSVPLLSGQYHGAIKANFFAPLLAISRDITVLRFANALLFATLPVIYLWAFPGERPPWPRVIYAVFGIILIPILYINVPFDHGQFIVPSLLLAVGIAAALRAQATKVEAYYWVAYTAGVLSVYEKLTQLNFAIPLCLWCLYFLLKYHLSRRTLLGVIIIPSAAVLPYLIYFVAFGGWAELMTATSSPKARFLQAFSDVAGSLVTHFTGDNNWTMSWLLGSSPSYAPLGYVTLALILMSVILWCFSRTEPAASALPFLWFITAGSVVVQSFVSGLIRPWHFFTYGILLYFLFGLTFELLRSRSRIGSSVVLLSTLTVAGYSFVGTLTFLRTHPPKGLASTALLDVASTIQRTSMPVRLICLDYSICSPLAFLLGSGATVKADYSFSTRDASLIQQVEAALNDPNDLLILRKIDITEDANFLKFLNDGSRFVFQRMPLVNYVEFYSAADHAGTEFLLYRKKR